jgi:hypothetical protein
VGFIAPPPENESDLECKGDIGAQIMVKGEERRGKHDLRCFNCQILYEFHRGKIFGKIRGEMLEELVKIGIKLTWDGIQSQPFGTDTDTSSR